MAYFISFLRYVLAAISGWLISHQIAPADVVGTWASSTTQIVVGLIGFTVAYALSAWERSKN